MSQPGPPIFDVTFLYVTPPREVYIDKCEQRGGDRGAQKGMAKNKCFTFSYTLAFSFFTS